MGVCNLRGSFVLEGRNSPLEEAHQQFEVGVRTGSVELPLVVKSILRVHRWAQGARQRSAGYSG